MTFKEWYDEKLQKYPVDIESLISDIKKEFLGG